MSSALNLRKRKGSPAVEPMTSSTRANRATGRNKISGAGNKQNEPVKRPPVSEPAPKKRKVANAVETVADSKEKEEDASDEPAPAPAPVSKLLIKRLSEKAKMPKRGSALAAGYDLCSAEQKIIPAHGKALIDTQLSIAVPVGTYGRVAPRSGLASKFMIDTGAGVIDADYRGVVFVLLFNLSDKDFQVEEGDRIAQLILERIVTPDALEVEDLDETIRGSGGFGSTGGHKDL